MSICQVRQERDFFQQAYENLRHELEALKTEKRQEREEARADLWDLRKTLADEREAIRHEREVYRERERIALLEKQRLWEQLEAATHEKRLLLEAPRPAAAAPPQRSPAGPLPATWEVILTHLQQTGPQRPEDVRKTLGLPQSPRHAMKRMWLSGYLVRVRHGV